MNKTLIALAVSLGVAACGGSSSSDAPPADATIGGIWYGFNFNAQLGESQELLGIGTEDGRFRFIEPDTRSQFAGIATSTGSMMTGSGLAFSAEGSTWLDASVVTSLDISGTLLDKQSLDANWTLASGETGNLGLFYSGLYGRDSSLDLTAGEWTSTDDAGAEMGTFSISADGLISGQDVGGCLYAGTLEIIDPEFNAYGFSVVVSNCGTLDGTFTGLSSLGDNQEPYDCLTVAADDGTRSLILSLERIPPG